MTEYDEQIRCNLENDWARLHTTQNTSQVTSCAIVQTAQPGRTR